MCEVMLGHESNGLERASLLYRLSDLHQRRGDVAAALEALGRLVAEDPYDATMLAHLERLAEQTGAWEQIVQLIRLVLGRPLPVATNITFRCRLGHIYRDRLGLHERATATFERVLDLDARHPEALLALTSLYERAQRWADLTTVLERRLAASPPPQERLALLERFGRARLQELAEVVRAPGERLSRLVQLARREGEMAGREASALAAWSHVVALAPDDDEAFAELERLCRSLGRWDRLAATLEARAARDHSSDATVRLIEAALLCEQRLGDAAAAFAVLERAHRRAPGHPDLLVHLERLARVTGV